MKPAPSPKKDANADMKKQPTLNAVQKKSTIIQSPDPRASQGNCS